MNNFEFFSLIFLLLDERWEKNKDGTLGHFLSEMNPYLWETEESADPAVYEKFKDFMKGRSIGEDYGYSLVNPYLDTIDFYPNIKRFLADVTQEKWKNAVNQLLSQPHKGDGKDEAADPNIEKYSLHK